MNNSFLNSLTPKEPKFFPILKQMADVMYVASNLMIENVEKGDHESAIENNKKIKEQDYFIPIIMLTALGTTNEKVEGFDAGADDYMVKPFEMKELLARIKALHKRSQYAPHENILKVEDLEVNLKTKQVMRAGNTIDLTPKEFNLLTYMLNNKGRVLSKSEIAEKVWDTKFDTGTNFIDVYISYLRRKIDKDYSKKLIQTKNGMGYILISHENPD